MATELQHVKAPAAIRHLHMNLPADPDKEKDNVALKVFQAALAKVCLPYTPGTKRSGVLKGSSFTGSKSKPCARRDSLVPRVIGSGSRPRLSGGWLRVSLVEEPCLKSYYWRTL